jgi:DNA modification methylase
MMPPKEKLNPETREELRLAALDQTRIQGFTHRFYRYPARFSPTFARTCILQFTRPGDMVLDPYMGGGTTVVEAHLHGRRAIGSDLNSLAVFVARAKVTALSHEENDSIRHWATSVIPALRCTTTIPTESRVPKNMTIPSARWLRKTISLCLHSGELTLTTGKAREFARCILLNVGQWALNGRKRIPSAIEFRKRVATTTVEMLAGADQLASAIHASDHPVFQPVLRQNDAEEIHLDSEIKALSAVDLVVTSPPYPGIHMLYHRWQVDGRKETDAPYWIAACNDGQGSSFYNFADRKEKAHHRYFEKATRSFCSIRRVMRTGAILAQMVAFSRPEIHLDQYLDALRQAGFREHHNTGEERIWRSVPSRKWHARSKGTTSSAREVVLLHEAV